MKPFTHLHVHSHYSLLNALPKTKALVAKAKEDGMKALALTDSGNMYGAIEFYMNCLKEDIKPIFGLDAYIAPRTRHDKETRVDARRTRLVFLAKNKTGYRNLMAMVTKSQLEGFYYKPRIDRELIKDYSEGLICISPFFAGDVSIALHEHNESKAKEFADFLHGVFKEDFYLEMCNHPDFDTGMERWNQNLAFAKKENIPTVASHDVYYINTEDRVARKTMISIQSSYGARDGNYNENEDFSFIKQADANERFKDIPEALDNNQKIVDQCDVHIKLEDWRFPDFIIESGREANDELKYVVYEGSKKRGIEMDEVVETRVLYELDVIKTKGYAPYFLVVADLLRYSRENDILTTIRGSVAGSMVTYLSGITNVNPLEYKLPFERFLNPERPSAPDIDMDFAEDRRDEVIEYTRKKYGYDKVAQIGTFGTMAARGSIRDTARALGFDYAIGDRISKMIPVGAQGFPMTIKRALEEVPELKELYDGDGDTREIMDMAQKIEGCARHIGIHAAGVVISPVPLIDETPLQYDPKGEMKIITQYDMRSVGEDGVGLLKFDFLGLKNLAILARGINLVKQLRGIDINIEEIPLDDTRTFEMLARGETAAVFQLSGSGMTHFLKDLKPSTIHDINAMVALYRPGPMESIPSYIERKHNPEKVTYLDDRLIEILDQSYGVITYQDDVMMTAIKLAGYSWLEADKLRKAMGKKIPELMKIEKKKLFDGLKKGGMEKDKIKELWSLIEPFAAYGFNKAHAASYGRVAYQTAYMKANFPGEYMTAVLTADSGDVDKIAEFVAESRRMDIEVLPPDVNESFEEFTIIKGNKDAEENDSIRFGLNTIKNFGSNAATAIIEARRADGPFVSFEDFLTRVSGKAMNKKSLDALTKTGALDSLVRRGAVLENLEEILAYNKELTRSSGQQNSLFGDATGTALPELHLKDHTPIPEAQKLIWEKELLGLYVSGHPLNAFKEQFAKKESTNETILRDGKEGESVLVAGIIDEVRIIRTKKGENMAFVTISDFSGPIEVVIFPKSFRANESIIVTDTCVALKGKMSERNGEKSVLCDGLKKLVSSEEALSQQ